MIGFSFTSDLKDWREFPGPITEQNNAKTKQSRITFGTKLKNALIVIINKTTQEKWRLSFISKSHKLNRVERVYPI